MNENESSKEVSERTSGLRNISGQANCSARGNEGIGKGKGERCGLVVAACEL